MQLIHGDCLEKIKGLPDNSVDSVVTDPPYGLSFMGKKWDYDVPSVEIWKECLRVLKPGGHLLSFAGTRTQHRMAVRIEDAGFEIRDMIAWVYGSGFPKSLDVSKAIDKRGGAQVAWFGPWFRKWREENGVAQKQVAALFPSKTGGMTGCVANWELGFNMPTPEQFNLIRDTFGLPFASVEEAEREVVGKQSGNLLAVAPGQENDRSAITIDITAPATEAAKEWEGWGTALKPALEPITVARKPLIGTVSENVQEYGTGAINVDGCRVGTEGGTCRDGKAGAPNDSGWENMRGHGIATLNAGRWPANLIHDGSEEVTGLFPANAGGGTATRGASSRIYGGGKGFTAATGEEVGYGDSGSAARFFYCAKANKKDRNDGCDGLEERTAGECTDRIEGSAGINNPRAGAGRTSGSRNHHPTVKPTDLMRYLVRLVTRKGGTVLDPFMGSGSTGKACVLEGMNFIGIEREEEYVKIAEKRIKHGYLLETPASPAKEGKEALAPRPA